MPNRRSDPHNSGLGAGVTGEIGAEEICRLLGLEASATCGFVRVTFVSPRSIGPGALAAPFADARPLGSALYFLVTPDAPVRLHRIRNDQLYHYYLGDPLEVFMLHDDGRSERASSSEGNCGAGGAAGSSARARSGRAWSRPTSKWAISTR